MKKILAAISILATLAGGWLVRQPVMTAITVATLAAIVDTNPALAANCSAFTYTLTNGTTADANQVMSNFNNLLTCANNNLAHNGANSDITSLSGLTTPLTVPQGGTGLGTLTSGAFMVGNGTSTPTFLNLFYPKPLGRLTLTSGAPVMTSDVTAGTTVYYDSFVGNTVPVGSTFQILTIGSNEISMGLDSVTPHIASGSVYDVFGVSNSGVLVICAGPAWSTTSSRGTGAGTTQLAQLNGLWVNANSLTHCYGGASGTTDYGAVAANAATYLGSIYATANGQTKMLFKPSAASGGTANVLGLYNAYNRVTYGALERDSVGAYSYNSTTWRTLNASSSDKVSILDGLGQSSVRGDYTNYIGFSSSSPYIGLLFNATSGTPAIEAGNSSSGLNITVFETFAPALGLNFVQTMEACSAASTCSFNTGNFGQNMALRVLTEM